jgi:ribonuclease Z
LKTFSLTILGSGAALPTAKRNPSGQFLNCNNRHILIDCGEGTQNQIRKHKLPLQRISHILISHLHGDHFFGLVGLLSTMHLLGRDKGIHIYGPPDLEQIIRMQLEIGGSRLPFSLNFYPLQKIKNQLIFEDKVIEIHSFTMKHRVDSWGFRIQEKEKERTLNAELFYGEKRSMEHIPALKKGLDVELEDGSKLLSADYTFPASKPKSYAYCSDTMYFEQILQSVLEVDYLYHEATFLHKELDRALATMHTTALQAGEIASKAKVKNLLIGHLSARYETGKELLAEAKSVFDNTFIVEDGDVFEF